MKGQKLITFVFVVLFTLLLPTITTAQESKKINLKYKFKTGDVLQYKSESHDSTTRASADETETMDMTRWTLQTLSVLDALPEATYRISIKIDSIWTDQDPSPREDTPGGGRSMRFRTGGPGGMGGRSREREYSITSVGKSTSKDPVISPFLLPLPQEAVAINDTWDYELTSEQRGRMQGTNNVRGQCLLYDIQKEGDKTIALIIVNTESKGEGSFNFEREGMEISGSSQSSGAGTSLVYFDVDRGRILEIVAENTLESATESSMFSSNVSSKSKSTIKLVSE
jgi:hypothetical protein